MTEESQVRYRCRFCNDIIIPDSSTRHQMQWCSCKKIAIDAEEFYMRVIGNPICLVPCDCPSKYCQTWVEKETTPKVTPPIPPKYNLTLVKERLAALDFPPCEETGKTYHLAGQGRMSDICEDCGMELRSIVETRTLQKAVLADLAPTIKELELARRIAGAFETIITDREHQIESMRGRYDAYDSLKEQIDDLTATIPVCQTCGDRIHEGTNGGYFCNGCSIYPGNCECTGPAYAR